MCEVGHAGRHGVLSRSHFADIADPARCTVPAETQCGSGWGLAIHGELRTRKSKSEKYMGVVRCPPKGFEQLLQVSERQTRAH